MMIMNPYAQATLITAIATFVLGIFVYSRDSRKKLYKIFALYSVSIGWWAMFSGLQTVVYDDKMALYLVRISHIGVVFIPILFTKFVLTLLDKVENHKVWLYSSYFFGFFLLLSIPTPFLIEKVVEEPYLNQILRAGSCYFLLILFFYLYVCRGLVIFYKGYKESKPSDKQRLGYLFWASIFGYIGGPLAFLYAFDISHPLFLSYAIYAAPFYAIITVYAIIKHHLLDINVVFKSSLVYSILVAAITLIYLIVVWFLERAFQTAVGYRSLPITLLALLTIAIIFQPLKNRIQRFVDLRFFKGTLEILAEERQKLQEEIRRTDQLRIAGALAAGIAHEIKNPLTSIKTFTRYLYERKNENDFIEKFQEVVGNEVSRIEGLVKNLLDFSKPNPLRLEKIDANRILDLTLGLVEHDLSSKSIRIERIY